jgi:uncharacterized repeat protein (TIGR03843 family)
LGRDGAPATEVTPLLADGALEPLERIPWASNATFLGRVCGDGGEALAVYKPQRGERPLWDFPAGTLGLREVAAYEVSQALGWAIVPATLWRDGPFGPGMVQLFIDHDPDEHYLTLREGRADRFKQFVAFDVVVNNADRKSGHCLRTAGGHVFGVDHGLTFHHHHKLRTVIWDFADEPIPGDVAAGLRGLQGQLNGALGERLRPLLAPIEVAAVGERVAGLLDEGLFPEPRTDYPYPWPLV